MRRQLNGRGRRIGCSNGLPHAFERFSDSKFAKPVKDIAALPREPQKQRAVVKTGERSLLQALERSRPTLPHKDGGCATTSRNRPCDGATTLAAVLAGTVLRGLLSLRRQGLLRFFATVRRAVWLAVVAALHFERRRRLRDSWTAVGGRQPESRPLAADLTFVDQ
jgi:hypothetical protein